jgi:glycine cleavage system transcriptional repressor
VAELAVTAVGADRPGIVAAVAEVLRERGGNVEDSAMTILGGHFAIVLLVASDDAPDDLRDALLAATSDLGLSVSVSRADAGHPGAEATHILSVYGADRPGILAGVTRTLADLDATVVDLETRVLGADTEPVYAMIVEVACHDADALERALAGVCAELGVDHTLRPIDAQTY